MTAITLSNINKRFGEKVLFRDYSLHIEAGEFVAIKGESGAGKTTLLNIIGLLETPDSGSITLCGARNPSFSSRAAVHLRRHKLSYLFQNYGLVDTDTVEANMKLATRFGKAKGKAEKERIADALAQMGLSGYERRKVYTLSGGEQQRVALARALAVKPEFIVCDEPISALDVSIQAQVINMFEELQEKLGVAYLFIAHDLNIVKYISDRIGVMYLGNMVELANTQELFDHPLHPYTEALMAAIPTTDVEEHRELRILEGDIPSPVNPPQGCKFHTRCAHCTEICKHAVPEWKEMAPGHFVACHHPLSEKE